MARKNFPLRISPDLYAALERWAADDLRSVNAQMEYLLTQAVRQAGRTSKATAVQDAAAESSAASEPQGR